MAVIVDYGMGNLRSVQKAMQRVGAAAEISAEPEVIAQADRLILPGVGAFGDAMRGLRERSLIEPIREFLNRGRPFLGICLGLQLLFDESEEATGEEAQGLGVLPGRVIHFPESSEHKVPHMGWNQVSARQDSPLLRGISDQAWFYFVHSYYVQPASESDVWLISDYILPFCAAIQHEHIRATQFHPEKSQAAGLQMLANFAAL